MDFFFFLGGGSDGADFSSKGVNLHVEALGEVKRVTLKNESQKVESVVYTINGYRLERRGKPFAVGVCHIQLLSAGVRPSTRAAPSTILLYFCMCLCIHAH